MSPTLAIAVGAAAGMAAQTRLLLASLLFAALLVGTAGVDAVPAAVLAAAAAWLTVSALDKQSRTGARRAGVRRAEPSVSRTRVTWLGHATVLIELGGVRLLTDPVLRARVVHLRRHGGGPRATWPRSTPC